MTSNNKHKFDWQFHLNQMHAYSANQQQSDKNQCDLNKLSHLTNFRSNSNNSWSYLL